MKRIGYLLLILFSLPTQAAKVNDLYNANVLLSSNDKQAEATAKVQGLQQVLIKVSGQSAIISNPIVQKALRNPNSYISSVSYQDDADNQRSVQLTFNDTPIRVLLSQAKANLWGSNRPLVLVWLVEDQNGSRSIAWDQGSDSILQAISDQADQRGLPVISPIGDLTDVTSVNVTDLWGGFINPVAKASERYSPDAILLIKAKKQGQNTVLDWQLFDNNPTKIMAEQTLPISGQSRGVTANSVKEVMGNVTQHFAQKYSISLADNSQSKLTLRVNHIESSEDYYQLEQLITNLEAVATLSVDSFQADELTLTVSLLANKEEFARELLLDPRLIFVKEESIPEIEESDVASTSQIVNGSPADNTPSTGIQGNAIASDSQQSLTMSDTAPDSAIQITDEQAEIDSPDATAIQEEVKISPLYQWQS
ncbi:DUF2066 domain-containing protein [Vibrio sp. SS-MA-C1-2]|uniref:DUF2066 domain-containing protein n=1 Tax=Vibrio sp. SS-MA-C1-2 TaxID=2908646 RepID=UPI001F28B6FE|nr:DUF2066 domain-containing protein [Vibrio sp. SS-MA-C1-2]UJF19780.1 DUF2066 domain-containing protein [Vibrio sp. SS-MA-C1-2]